MTDDDYQEPWQYFCRDSRHAFGDNQRFRVEEPRRDWLRGLAVFIFYAVVLAAWIIYRMGR
jgi:hypothetical protein